MSTKRDADNFLKFITDCFVKKDNGTIQQLEETNDVMKSTSNQSNGQEVREDTAGHSQDCLDLGQMRISDGESCDSKLPLGKQGDSILPFDNSNDTAMTSRILAPKPAPVTNADSADRQTQSDGTSVSCYHGDVGLPRGVEAARLAGNNKMVLTNILNNNEFQVFIKIKFK